MTRRDLSDQHRDTVLLQSEKVYRGAIWDVSRERFDYNGEELSRDFVDHPGAVSVVALNEHDEIMMIRQYRHAIRAIDWEIPAGLLDIPGEDPLVCAKRELLEEADLEAEQWKHLTRLNTTPGGSNESTHIFLATGLIEASHDYVRTGEEADMEKIWVPLADAIDSILAGEMTNQISVTAILAAHASRQ
jgi:ADP-ribose pyrophosphatase